jgi:hypothetical protein
MKTSDRQKEICNLIIDQASFWRDSNDINSPTHGCDIDESVGSLDWLAENDAEDIKRLLYELYIRVKRIV